MTGTFSNEGPGRTVSSRKDRNCCQNVAACSGFHFEHGGVNAPICANGSVPPRQAEWVRGSIRHLSGLGLEQVCSCPEIIAG